MNGIKVKQWHTKLLNWEYWPMWIYYFPVWIQHFWLSIKVGNLFFFLKTNPAIDGFILSDSKYKTLQLVPEDFKPKAVFVKKDNNFSEVFDQMKANNIAFPVICKPDIGYRGLKVIKVNDKKHLLEVLSTITVDSIIQEYVADEVEIGLFYYRFPGQEKGVIPSLTIKNYLSIVGDGKNTVSELIHQNPRAILYLPQLEKKFKNFLDNVLPLGKKMILETIGNHNKGTEFKNGNHLIDEDLLAVFDELSHRMKGFYFGRFDIKTDSLVVLKKEKRFKILEVNGVGGEPTHIYDPQTSIITIWRELCSVWRIAAKIAKYNFNDGVRRPSFREGYYKWKAFSKYKSNLI